MSASWSPAISIRAAAKADSSSVRDRSRGAPASTSQEVVLEVLRGFTEVAKLDERRALVVFRQREGANFSFDCELVEDGTVSERAGAYFPFLGMFVEALTGACGPVTVEDV